MHVLTEIRLFVQIPRRHQNDFQEIKTDAQIYNNAFLKIFDKV